MLRKLLRSKKGQALAEYAVLLGGILLVTIVAVAILGHKINDMTALTAVILPGAHAEDNGPIVSGKIIETTAATPGGDPIGLDVVAIEAAEGTSRLGSELGVLNPGDVELLVVEP